LCGSEWRSCCCSLLRQLHPAVCEGVILALLDSVIVGDLVLHGLGEDCFKGGPHAMLVEANHLRGPPIETACIGDHLVVLHCLHHVAVANDVAVAWGEPTMHHTMEVLLQEASPVHGCHETDILEEEQY
jgi:hypothetical protein